MTRSIFSCGILLFLIMTAVGQLDARAEITTFLGLLGLASVVYLITLCLIGCRQRGSSRALVYCLLLGALWRVVLIAGAPLVSDDVYRYIWDGRVQRFGYNPYESVPKNSELTHLYTENTERISPTSSLLPTIYPPAAQLFFRVVTTVDESVTMMVAVVVLSDLLTALVLWRWLVYQKRNPWWVLAYAWHPLVAIEGAGGGHIDLVGTLFVVVAAYLLSLRRSGLAMISLAISFSFKFLPIVLLPLTWYRVKARDFILAIAVVCLLYLPFSDGFRFPLGSLLVYVDQWRFNGPLFLWLEQSIGTFSTMIVAVSSGLIIASLARVWLPRDSPEAWAWPMATTLLMMPTVYPWYLVWLTPFLSSLGTFPLVVWTLVSLGTYVVWASELSGMGWFLPAWIQILEYGLVAVAGLTVLVVYKFSSNRVISLNSNNVTERMCR